MWRECRLGLEACVADCASRRAGRGGWVTDVGKQPREKRAWSLRTLYRDQLCRSYRARACKGESAEEAGCADCRGGYGTIVSGWVQVS